MIREIYLKLRISKQTSQRRRAAYQYYRRVGFSVKEAQRRRGQSKGVWLHYNQAGKRAGVKPPAILSSKAEKTAIREELRAVGFSTRSAYNVTRRCERGMQSEIYKVRRGIGHYQKALGISKKAAMKRIYDYGHGTETISGWWDDFAEVYDEEWGLEEWGLDDWRFK